MEVPNWKVAPPEALTVKILPTFHGGNLSPVSHLFQDFVADPLGEAFPMKAVLEDAEVLFIDHMSEFVGKDSNGIPFCLTCSHMDFKRIADSSELTDNAIGGPAEMHADLGYFQPFLVG